MLDIAWAVFAMLLINGAATMVQALRIGPVGNGLLVITYPSPTAIPFCIIALQEGGPQTLTTLIVISSLVQIIISMRLSVLRRLMTPAFNGAILLLLIITFIPVVFNSLDDLPANAVSAAGPVCIAVTFVVTMGLMLRGSATLRNWSTLIGIVAGCIASVAFGIFDFGAMREAQWTGIPWQGWPGFALDFGIAFWTLLPAFLFLSVVSVLQGTSIALSIQRVSWRDPRAIDYRRVQGMSICTALGNLLGGIASVMPVVTSPRGTAFVHQTRCASREIGLITGAILFATAFFPKFWNLLNGIPAPVTATFLVVMLSPLVVEAMKMIVQDNLDLRTTLVIGSSILIGIGFQTGLVPIPLGNIWEAVFQKAFVSGGVMLVFLGLVVNVRKGRQKNLRVELNMQALPRLNAFLENFATGKGWDAQMANRLQHIGEEVLLILTENRDAGAQVRDKNPSLQVSANRHGNAAELEFVRASTSITNLEDQLALLSNVSSEEVETGELVRDMPLRLLHHQVASITHRQYHDIEVITALVLNSDR